MPFIGEAAPVDGGWQWVLTFPLDNQTVRSGYLLTSAPPLRTDRLQATSRVRGMPTVVPCTAALCWREQGIDYAIGTPDIGKAPITRPQATALAARLAYG
jgi:hypothetical protein